MMKQYLDIPFSETEKRQLLLDIYLPDDIARPQLIIWIHGGAWLKGDKQPALPLKLLEHGFALACITYRFSHEALFPAQLVDCVTALNFLKEKSGEYGYSSEKVGLIGSSSGGHLAALMGTTSNQNIPENFIAKAFQVDAVVDMFGPVDFLSMLGQGMKFDAGSPKSPESRLLGAPIESVPDLVKSASPITYISELTPPFLIIHGTNDSWVPINQSELLYSALKTANKQVELIKIAGVNHEDKIFYADENIAQIADFFKSSLE